MRLHNRQVKSEFWQDPDLAMLPRDARFLFAGLWALADDSGCVEDKPVRFKMHLFASPVDSDLTVERISELRNLLTERTEDGGAPFLVPYESDGKRCLYVRNFHKHQNLRNPSQPGVPLPPWITWVPTPSNPRAGRYQVDDDVLTRFLRGDLDQLTDCLQPASEPRTLNLEPRTSRPEGGTGGTAQRPSPPAYPPAPMHTSADAEPAGANAPPAVDKRHRKPTAMEDPEARKVAKAVYDAMKAAGSSPAGGQSWWAKACTEGRKLSSAAREVIGDATSWSYAQPEPRRGILVNYLSRCKFALVVDEYQAGRQNGGPAPYGPHPPRASPPSPVFRGDGISVAERRRQIELARSGEEF